MGYGINNYIDNLPNKYDSNKKISLYYSIIKYNPQLIKDLNKKLYVKINFINTWKEKKWYNSIIEYLIQTEVISIIQSENEIYHKINDKYKKYFLNSESIVYHTENYNKHLMLYKEAVKEFLEITALTKNEEKKDLTKKDIPENWKKTIQTIGTGFIVISMYLYINFFSLVGIKNGILIILNSIMFTAGILLNLKL